MGCSPWVTGSQRLLKRLSITQHKAKRIYLFKALDTAAAAVQLISHVRLFATSWTVACQVPLFMGFSRCEYWSGLPFPSPGDLPDPGIEPRSPALAGGSLPLNHLGSV